MGICAYLSLYYFYLYISKNVLLWLSTTLNLKVSVQVLEKKDQCPKILNTYNVMNCKMNVKRPFKPALCRHDCTPDMCTGHACYVSAAPGPVSTHTPDSLSNTHITGELWDAPARMTIHIFPFFMSITLLTTWF